MSAPCARSRPGATAAPGGRVGAAIVNYSAGEHLAACVASLRSEGVAEVVVADNGSWDGSLQRLTAADSDARVLRLGRNLGYGAGANRALAVLRSELALVCNPDTVLRPGALAAMVAPLDADPQVALVGPLIESSEGVPYPSARTFPSLADSVGHAFLGLFAPHNRFSRRYKMQDQDPDTERKVDWVSGACFLARASALAELGGFDEGYFMYAEDMDLCWRANRAGWVVLYQPAARVVHVQGVSTDHHPYRMILEHHRSAWRFARKSTEGPRRALLPAMAAGLGLRAALACAQRGWREAAGR